MVWWVCSTEGLAAEGASSGGSSAVEQRTVKCASAAILWSGVQISLSGFFFSFGAGWGGPAQVGVPRAAVESSYDHTTVKAPHPIRTAKLSTVGPDQYCDQGCRGNLGCRMACQGYWRNRKRACLASTRYWDRNPDTPRTSDMV